MNTIIHANGNIGVVPSFSSSFSHENFVGLDWCQFVNNLLLTCTCLDTFLPGIAVVVGVS